MREKLSPKFLIKYVKLRPKLSRSCYLLFNSLRISWSDPANLTSINLRVYESSIDYNNYVNGVYICTYTTLIICFMKQINIR